MAGRWSIDTSEAQLNVNDFQVHRDIHLRFRNQVVPTSQWDSSRDVSCGLRCAVTHLGQKKRELVQDTICCTNCSRSAVAVPDKGSLCLFLWDRILYTVQGDLRLQLLSHPWVQTTGVQHHTQLTEDTLTHLQLPNKLPNYLRCAYQSCSKLCKFNESVTSNCI